MKYNQLGNSGIKVSEIGFGCMSLKKDDDPDPGILRQAFDEGINFFDTADLYEKGWNESLVGKALKSIRDKVIIATKVGNEWRSDGSGWDWNPGMEYILKAVDQSLKRLQTDYIDLYQLHGGTIEDPVDEIIEAFEILKNQGKIRAYGISSIRPNVIREWVRKSKMDSVMMQYSILDRRPEEESLELLAENNISALTRGSLAKGMLIDKPATDYLGYSESQVQDIMRFVKQTKTPLSASLQYVLGHPAVDSAVTGFRTYQQMQEAISSMNNEVAEGILAEIADRFKPLTYTDHR